MDILVGLIALVIGIAVCVSGLKLFFVILPMWGFVAGFLAGAAGVSAVFGDGFLATTLGLVTGIVVGLIFSALSYLYWYIGVILAAGTAGSIVGGALFASLGVTSSWLLFFMGLIVGAIFIVAALIFRYPVYLVAVNTALAGSTITIGGLLLVLNRIDREELGTGLLWQKLSDNWVLWLLWAVLAAIGLGAQLQVLQKATLPSDRWTKVHPARPLV